MADFSARELRPELIDQGHMPEAVIRRSLCDLRRVNKIFGGRRLLLEALKRAVESRRLRRFTVLDIASGSCDLPIAILDWAEQRQLQARVFALEYWHKYLVLFANEFQCYRNLHPVCADAFRAPFSDQTFDFVTCSLFLHHLAEDRAVELLSNMARWARHGVIVNDLERQPLPYYFFRLCSPLFTRCAMSRIDGLISIKQSFRKPELEKAAKTAGLEHCTIQRRWPFRLLLAASTDDQ